MPFLLLKFLVRSFAVEENNDYTKIPLHRAEIMSSYHLMDVILEPYKHIIESKRNGRGMIISTSDETREGYFFVCGGVNREYVTWVWYFIP